MSSLSVKSIVVLSLAASALAAPAPFFPIRRQDNTTEPTEPEEPEEPTGTDTDLTFEEFCGNVDLNTFEGVQAVWNDRGVGRFHDDFLSRDNYANEGDWIDKMASAAFPNSGDAGGFGCGFRDQDCFENLPDCQTMYDDGFGYEYWIFNAAQKMQGAIEHAHENLQDSVIDASLSVSIIADDFKIEFTTPADIWRYVSAAFGMAGGLVGFGTGSAVNAAKASAGLFGGSFAAGAVDAANTIPDPSPDMDRALKDIFAHQRELLDHYLSLGAGGEGDKNELVDRGQIDGADPKSAIAGFFAQGRFLLQGEDVGGYFSAGYDVLTKKLVDIAMNTYGYKILADHNQEDEGMCGENAYAFWMDIDGGRCMRLTYKDGENNIYPPVGEDTINMIQDDYALDLKHLFDVACDCAVNGDGTVEDGEIPEDGQPPRCFYNMPCMDAEIWLQGDNPDDDEAWVIGWPIEFKEVMSWDD